jgi:hypothetical protein
VRTFGWPSEFREVSWPEIARRFQLIYANNPAYRPMVDIVDNVITCGATAQLAGCTSMGDLIVVTRPIPQSPIDEVVVRFQSSYDSAALGDVIIEHLTHMGRNDRIRRPGDQAVPLFWRFMIEKYGIYPTPTGAPTS